jgi:hypothetical protein
MTVRAALYIDSGKLNGFYTLRSVRWSVNENGQGFYVDQFSKTLARSWEKAFAKYLEICAKRPECRQQTQLGDEFELNEWGAGGSTDWSVRRFQEWRLAMADGIWPMGKHRGVAVADLPSDYRHYMRGLARDNIAAGNKFAARSWTVILEGIAEFEEIDVYTAEAAEAARATERQAREAAKVASVHVGAIGQRIEAKLTCVAKFSYESAFGEGYISIFRDEAGNALKTFGKCNLVKGESAIVKFTVVKHEEYKGERQTMINRLKVGVCV